jgi:FAD synthetase
VNYQHFSEEETYVFDIIKNEEVDTIYLNSDFISGIYFLKSRFPEISNIYMGIRQIDLSENKQTSLTFVEKSTSPYPNFNRIYPIINWTYEDVWRLIILMDYPYLSLYDKGYTSIGKFTETQMNQHLSIG